MSIAERLLRLGVTLVAWLLVYTLCLWLAIVPAINCDTQGDQFWRMLLGFAPIAAGAGLALGLTRSLPGVHQVLRYLSIPLVVLVPLAVAGVYPTLVDVNLSAGHICGASGAWQSWWAPVQLTALAWLCYRGLRTWRA